MLQTEPFIEYREKTKIKEHHNFLSTIRKLLLDSGTSDVHARKIWSHIAKAFNI